MQVHALCHALRAPKSLRRKRKKDACRPATGTPVDQRPKVPRMPKVSHSCIDFFGRPDSPSKSMSVEPAPVSTEPPEYWPSENEMNGPMASLGATLKSPPTWRLRNSRP